MAVRPTYIGFIKELLTVSLGLSVPMSDLAFSIDFYIFQLLLAPFLRHN